jgi:hypothetical protein
LSSDELDSDDSPEGIAYRLMREFNGDADAALAYLRRHLDSPVARMLGAALDEEPFPEESDSSTRLTLRQAQQELLRKRNDSE